MVTTKTSDNTFTLRLNLRWVVAALLVVIVLMLALWRPWQARAADNGLTISVTGDATLTADPDEYVFTPSYEVKNTDKTAALKDISDKSNAVVPKLKALGVADNKIKSDANGYNYNYYFDENDDTYSYTLNLTVTVDNQALAQKVQDYLVTTDPSGQVTPQADFSTARRKQLEAQARDQATKDARSKADQWAHNLGFSVGKVKSVNDGSGFGTVQPLLAEKGAMAATDNAAPSLAIQPGQNELNYSVTVVYYLR